MHLQRFSLNTAKCMALPIVRESIDTSLIRQLALSEEWRYFGIDFRAIGAKKAGESLKIELDRIARTPLKPQQRLKIQRHCLLSHRYHKLVLDGRTESETVGNH